MIKQIITIFIILIGLFLLLWYFFSDTQTNKYINFVEVQNDKAIIRGWLPNILPKSAYEIEETHNLDTNFVFGTFKYKEKDEIAFIRQLMKSEKDSSIMTWDDFLFNINKKTNFVEFYNKEYEKMNEAKK